MAVDFTMGEQVMRGTILFVWKFDGLLRSTPDGTLTRMAPVGMAGEHLDAEVRVRVLNDGIVRRLIYNPCGDRHFGRCCINGIRPDDTRGMTCTHCGAALTQDQRDEIAESFAVVAMLRKRAGAT